LDRIRPQRVGARDASNARAQFVQFSGRVIIDPAEHIGEPGLRINAVQLGGLDQRKHRGGTFPTSIGAGE